jgi:hypothetical protein
MYNAIASRGSANSLWNRDDDVGVLLAIDILHDKWNATNCGTIIFRLIGLDWGPISESSLNAEIKTNSTPPCQALALCARTSCQHLFFANALSEKDVVPHLNPADPKACVCSGVLSFVESSETDSPTASPLTMVLQGTRFFGTANARLPATWLHHWSIDNSNTKPLLPVWFASINSSIATETFDPLTSINASLLAFSL